jgi:hypothetical protein
MFPSRIKVALADRKDVHDENAVGSVPIQKQHRAGLQILLAAYDYAGALQLDVWDFAVDIADLRSVGLHSADLRWLLCQGFLDHGYEKRPVAPNQREFRHEGGLVFRSTSCFVLTEAGIALARRVCGQLPPEDPPPQEHAPPARAAHKPLVPTWDADRQQLRLGDKLVKEFKLPAPNQELVLAAFEEEGWPVRIDDPLPPHPEQDSKQRLHSTLNALNRHQKNHLLRFCGDGRGQGIRWECLPPTENGNGKTVPGV